MKKTLLLNGLRGEDCFKSGRTVDDVFKNDEVKAVFEILPIYYLM